MPADCDGFGAWPDGDPIAAHHDLLGLGQAGFNPSLVTLLDPARDSALRQGHPTLWFGRRWKPVTAVFLMGCQEAGLPWERGFRGKIAEADFPRLSNAAARMASSPLSLCLAGDRADLNSPSALLAGRLGVRLAICDGVPGLQTLAAMLVASSELNVSIVVPGPG